MRGFATRAPVLGLQHLLGQFQKACSGIGANDQLVATTSVVLGVQGTMLGKKYGALQFAVVPLDPGLFLLLVPRLAARQWCKAGVALQNAEGQLRGRRIRKVDECREFPLAKVVRPRPQQIEVRDQDAVGDPLLVKLSADQIQLAEQLPERETMDGLQRFADGPVHRAGVDMLVFAAEFILHRDIEHFLAPIPPTPYCFRERLPTVVLNHRQIVAEVAFITPSVHVHIGINVEDVPCRGVAV
mmetsp:Transcript_131621/g.228013  ORF Transcript_131621/g.228013 Transcript_131621/m.228013 type:complete len:242 (+) Transcript_131621:58-783(+)